MQKKGIINQILFVEQNRDRTVGGSYYSLLYLVRAIDRNKYFPLVMFYEENHMIQRFVDEGCEVFVYHKPIGAICTPSYPILSIPFAIAQKAYNFVNVSLMPLLGFIRFIIKNDIDVVHLNNTASVGWEWLVASKLLGKKCITHERGFAKFGRFAKVGSRYFDKIICVSDAVRWALRQKGLEANVVTIYNGIDLEEFKRRIKKNPASVRDEFGVSRSTPLIGMVGNFREWKGQRIVVESLAIIREKHPDILCLLVGDVATTSTADIKYFQEIKKEISSLHLDKNIIITGYRDDVPDLMNACDIIVHSSIEPEPFGRVIIEAMLLKKPVVATEQGGPLEIIENELSGYLIPPGRADLLAEKIDYLLQNPKIRDEIGKNAFNRVVEQFSMEKFSMSIDKLYDNIFREI